MKKAILLIFLALFLITGCKEKISYEEKSLENATWSGDWRDLNECRYRIVTLTDEPESGWEFKEGILSVEEEIVFLTTCEHIVYYCHISKLCDLTTTKSRSCSGRDCDIEFTGHCVCTFDEYESYGNSIWYVKKKSEG